MAPRLAYNGPAIWGGCVPAIGGVAHFLQSGYRVLWPLRASRYRVVKVLVNYPDAVKFIEGSGAVRVCQAVLSCLGSRNRKQKV
jgi:hypothetical protein